MISSLSLYNLRSGRESIFAERGSTFAGRGGTFAGRESTFAERESTFAGRLFSENGSEIIGLSVVVPEMGSNSAKCTVESVQTNY